MEKEKLYYKMLCY